MAAPGGTGPPTAAMPAPSITTVRASMTWAPSKTLAPVMAVIIALASVTAVLAVVKR